MNILFISQYFYPEPFSNNEIAQALVKRGHDVEVVCCVPNYPEGVFYEGYSNSSRRLEKWNGIRILRARTKARGKGRFSLLLNYLTYPLAALAMVAKNGTMRYSISFTSMPSPIFQCIVALVLKKFRGVPAVFWVQDIWPESLIDTIGLKNRLVKSLLTKFCSYLYRSADVVLIQSEAFRARLEKMGVSSAQINFFPNTAPDEFVPLAKSEVDPAILSLLPETPLRLMFAGNIGESQNLDLILNAAAKLRQYHSIQWVIVGNGRDLERIRQRVTSAEIDDVIKLVGRYPTDKMPDFYALADAMIISLKDTEIFRLTVPYKLQTYMGAGKPVVGSISGETKRIIEQANMGYCAEAGDLEGFCDAVVQFALLSTKQRVDLSLNARDYFNTHYNADKVFGDLERKLRLVAQDYTPEM
jgi:glycosyltransferase involved in cell wall biosynthesis